ncbi:hypothetical protein ACFQS7_26370 [Dankookia sp. GCM10030260]|uniref:hypothetical protein n=1 Tax=Dankookia sp. GCM10030260 TaxID=3273390 RepID=UPI003611C2CD
MEWQSIEGYVPLGRLEDFLVGNKTLVDSWRLKKTLNTLLDLSCKLSDGVIEAAGIEQETGELIEIHASAWRIYQHAESFLDNLYLIEEIRAGRRIMILGSKEGIIICYPIIALRSLALAFGAENPPPAPSVQPRDWITASAIALRDDQTLNLGTALPPRDAAATWMRGYARAMQDAGLRPKRDQTLRLCQVEAGCTYRQALAAWNSLPADWKNHTRTPT